MREHLTRGRRRRVGRAAVVGAVVLAAGAATAAATGLGLPAGQDAGEAHSSLPPATARVTRQTLVDAQTVSGGLGFGAASPLNCRLGGTVTALPAPGTTVRRGQAVYRIDNAPVLLLYGTLPAYRALRIGTKGSDVSQFERNLAALGYRGFTVDKNYTWSTAAAVRRWQDDLGLPRTGAVEMGRVVYAAGPVRVETQKAAVGDTVQPAAAVLTVTGTTRVVVAELDMAHQRLARKGSAVTVALPDGRQVAGKISLVEFVIKPAEGQNPATTKLRTAVALADAKAVAGMDHAAVDVSFTAAKRDNVLTVPVAALLALAEGGYGVQVVADGRARIVAVRTGLFSGGRVEVSGAGLTEGMTVGVPS